MTHIWCKQTFNDFQSKFLKLFYHHCTDWKVFFTSYPLTINLQSYPQPQAIIHILFVSLSVPLLNSSYEWQRICARSFMSGFFHWAHCFCCFLLLPTCVPIQGPRWAPFLVPVHTPAHEEAAPMIVSYRRSWDTVHSLRGIDLNLGSMTWEPVFSALVLLPPHEHKIGIHSHLGFFHGRATEFL